MDQAHQARKQADQAAARLRDAAARDLVGRTLESDIDRLEMAAREFGRRMVAVSDAVASCGQSDQFAAEILSLQKRCAQMLETVQLIRSDGVSSTLPLLDHLLQDPT